MSHPSDILPQISRIARCSRDFFVEVYPSVVDAQVRTAFAYVGDVKNRLYIDLAPWVVCARRTGAGHLPADANSPAVLLEKLYVDVHRTFRGDLPTASADALSYAEERLLKLVERGCEQSRDLTLAARYRSWHLHLTTCREAMWRLRSRLAA